MLPVQCANFSKIFCFIIKIDYSRNMNNKAHIKMIERIFLLLILNYYIYIYINIIWSLIINFSHLMHNYQILVIFRDSD